MLLALGGAGTVGVGFWAYRRLTTGEDLPERPLEGARLEPEPPAVPGSTGKKGVDAILSKLRKAAFASGIPLGLLVGWIAKESAGRLATKPQPGPGDNAKPEDEP